ncbi:MAG TPA: methyltransferase [Candidatus Acidoferrales bacterium]|nr:methyltransferase [Candidatus Acidoferrales bacterium]
MPRKTTKTPLSPAMVMEDLTGAWRSRTLVAGVELGIFGHIATGKRTVNEIAEAAEASPRGVATLLDALTAIGYLRKTGNRYGLRPISAAFLVSGRKAYVGAMAHALSLTWDAWKDLSEAVRSGRPVETVDVAEKGKTFFPKLVASIFPGNFAASTVAVSGFAEKERRKIHKILDVAAGSGAWSLAFARAIPEARVTTVDFPEMTPITREFAQKLGVAARYDYLEGDVRLAEFGHDTYDLIILGHIIHSEGEEHGKELLAKSYAALRAAGKLLIAEYVPNDARTGPAMPLLFGLNMLLQTEVGAVFTLREYRIWLKAVGFRNVATIPVPPPSTVMIATK